MTAADTHGALISALAGHLRSANHHGVASLLHPDAVLTVDGGPALGAVVRSARGRRACAAELVRIMLRELDPVIAEQEINGARGLVIRARGSVVSVIVASTRGGLIDELWAVLNPEKLGRLSQPGQPPGRSS
jgi:RNA polymerase sigma-70 factor (ECF subfamily)